MEMNQQTAERVAQLISEIKAHMPDTYAAIKARAAERQSGVYETVRRGLAGEANCFYAIEGGRVVGTPFDLPNVMPELAAQIVQFGCRFVCMLALPKAGGATDGAH